MKTLKQKWKLGLYVLLRCIHFYIFLCIHLILLIPAGFLGEWLVEANPIVKIFGGVVCFAYVIFLLPLIFYWTASRSGHMQGEDRHEIRKLQR